ncbi:unknown protein [Cronobacter turicensis z3032]|uniref:Uncharacterized protein n=1 Tax=Cronobacter turicensis (strain DSM 18703 / CCUG 55852 / LMG 23827 / z3032) TaxID=693216 RepID=C9Y4G5_CROTZ|nr:unknown protein [Cronobacter turicensis z3032]
MLKTVTTFALLPFRLFHKGRKNEICVTKWLYPDRRTF